MRNPTREAFGGPLSNLPQAERALHGAEEWHHALDETVELGQRFGRVRSSDLQRGRRAPLDAEILQRGINDRCDPALVRRVNRDYPTRSSARSVRRFQRSAYAWGISASGMFLGAMWWSTTA